MRSGATPVTRAACTYSLLRSTSVEPRTVRAYCTQPVERDRQDQHAERHGVVRIGEQRAADAGDQQRDQDGGKGQHHVAHAASGRRRSSRRGSPPAGPSAHADRARTAAPTPRRPPAKCARRRSAAERMSRPWSSVPSRYLALPSCCPRRRQAGVAKLQRGQVERVVRRDPARRTPRRTRRRTRSAAASDGHGRGAEAVPDVAVASQLPRIASSSRAARRTS